MFILLLWVILCIKAQEKNEFTVLQWNIWQEGTQVKGGYDAIVDEIVRLKPDFVTLSEVRNYKNTRFCDRIVQSLKQRGEIYYSFFSYDSGLLSRYPITDSLTVFPLKDDHGSIYKMVSSIHGHRIAVYTAHLDYLSDAYYNVRGYDGSTWKEIPIPQTVCEVLQVNDASLRDDAIRNFIAEAKKDIAEGTIVILGGDFNEPSHLDWTRETKDLFDLTPRLDARDKRPLRPQRPDCALDGSPASRQQRFCRYVPRTLSRRYQLSRFHFPCRQPAYPRREADVGTQSR